MGWTRCWSWLPHLASHPWRYSSNLGQPQASSGWCSSWRTACSHRCCPSYQTTDTCWLPSKAQPLWKSCRWWCRFLYFEGLQQVSQFVSTQERSWFFVRWCSCLNYRLVSTSRWSAPRSKCAPLSRSRYRSSCSWGCCSKPSASEATHVVDNAVVAVKSLASGTALPWSPGMEPVLAVDTRWWSSLQSPRCCVCGPLPGTKEASPPPSRALPIR